MDVGTVIFTNKYLTVDNFGDNQNFHFTFSLPYLNHTHTILKKLKSF